MYAYYVVHPGNTDHILMKKNLLEDNHHEPWSKHLGICIVTQFLETAVD